MADEKPEAEDEPIEIDEKGDESPVEPIADHQSTTPKDRQTASDSGSRWSRFKHWYSTNKKLSIPLTILAIILLTLLIPQTRYTLPGLFYKKDFSVAVLDAETNKPVSGATVSVGSVSAETGGDGKAKLHLSVGSHNLTVTKKYYADEALKVTVPLLSQKSVPDVSFDATGRQVNITVTNLINHKPVANAEIKIADATSKTDASGNAQAVVPETTKQAKAIVSAQGYNNNEVTVEATAGEVKQNDLKLTPAGKIYFLSKLSGKIDVVKSDLDGKNRKTVLPGSGDEQDSNTVLLASRDWKHLALLSRLEGGNPKLFLINTDTDKIFHIDEGDATFTPIGWDDNNFLYQVERHKVKDWQSGKFSIKSFNADTRQITPIDSTAGVGKSEDHYAHESYDYAGSGFYIVDHYLIYDKTWDYSYDDPSYLTGKHNSLHKIGVSGSGHQTMLSYSVDKYLNSFLYKPRVIYYKEPVSGKYYVYQNGNLQQSQSIAKSYERYEETYNSYTYLLSPDGQKTFWYEQRDGKNSLLLGDIDANNPVAVGRDEKLTPYGWYSDDYLILTKDASELYVMPKEGMSDSVKPVKITDYHKPSRSFYGYGGGYGGL